jgi:trk system potassium uptake protein TrkA
MKIVVVGCGRTGAELAHRFLTKGHEVTVIDNDASALDHLPADFAGRVVEGEPLSEAVLHRAGVDQADAVAVVTDNDTVNAVVAHVCRAHYQVPRVVVRNYDPRRMPLLTAFGLQAVGSVTWGAHRLEEMLYNTGADAVFSAGNGEVEVFEIQVPAAWAGRGLNELLEDGEQTVAVALTRSGHAVLPSSTCPLAEGDLLHVSATSAGIQGLRRRLGMEG